MKAISFGVKTGNGHQVSTRIDEYGIEGHLSKDEIIYSPAHPENATFYLKTGYVQLVNQEKCITRVVGPGEFFGDRSIFHSKKVYTQALSNIEYVRVDEQSFSQLMYSNVKLATDIITSLSKHSIFLNEKQNLFSLMKELYAHIKKGNSVKLLLMNWKKNKVSSPCCN
ncbi:cyclic nucleotide-binding domain-containing protein [Aquibacillus sp. 3ASR75-11]|uniref:Cyclic nucleotide-binding domain-containing protein n=1 Tax=Terrihalobacillus insolitus TaxID=2950438 RepID=A0A9X3WTS7_9BACI|nr:cyclic nucleotide-binding domain-containing protein [Terrihalobacillus insolitus]MDC3424101.1 cyclic nucleotide-binding domain-containing protein [Terrihalobacillus insolitus]